jgi:Co/Zn/Cd efflux system component/copper chaperone CopZ
MTTATYRVAGMDCPSCVAKIEKVALAAPGVTSAEVSLTSQTMSLDVDAEDRLPAVEAAISDLGYRLARTRASGEADDDHDLPDLSHVTPAYKRALWIVVGLNAAYGVAELIGGFIARSQAVKADALDFLGDGLISFLGLVAITWAPRARARAALLQGFFLAALGLGVLGATIYRVFVQQAPEAPLMGLLGIGALIINVAAVWVLLPHRGGDANMRAVWLFSRNDAIGNAAVVVAAGLVAWTGSAWPDLVVAFVVASLFLHSAGSIIADARRELVGKRP